MKKVRIAMFLAVIAALLVATGVLALFFNNGSFESGSWTPGWDAAGQRTFRTFTGGYTGTGYPNLSADGTGADLRALVGGPSVAALSISDPNTATVADPAGALKYPAFGHYSARINSQDAWSGPGHARNANTLYQQTVVDAADVDPGDNKVHLRMMYAAVLVDPGSGHTTDEVPMFFLEVKDVTANTIIFHDQAYVGDPSHTWQTGACVQGDCAYYGTYKFLDWTLIDTIAGDASIVGHTLSVEVIATGCSLGGHAGYVYVDEIGSRLPGPMLSASAPATTFPNPATYTYTVEYTVPADRTNGHLNLTVPANTTYVAGSLSDASCNQAAGAITCDWPSITTGTHSFTFDVQVDSGVTVGTTLSLTTYSIYADGTNTTIGTQIDTLVVAPPPSAFGKITPLNGATNVALATPLVWETSVGASSYEYCIETDGNNTCNGSWTSTLTATTASPILVVDTTYNWQVRAVNTSGTTEANGGTWWTFSTAPANTAPVAVDDAYLTQVNTTLNGTAVLVNDTDADLNPLTAVLNVGPAHTSSFTLNPNGTFTYVPVTNFVGEDTFTYHVNDGLANSNIATVTIDVIAPLPDDWEGSGVVESDKPIVTVIRPQLYTPAQVSSYDGFGSGSLTAYLPMLFKSAYVGSTFGTFESAFYIQNVDPAGTAAVTIKFINTDGTEACTVNNNITQLASKGYWMKSLAGCPSLVSGWVGSAKITSDRNIVVVGRPHIGNEVMTYNGFSAGATTVSLPMLFKQVWGGYEAAMYVQNVSALPADITIKFYDKLGALTCTMPVATLPALSTKGYWLPTQGCLPAGWAGGAVITSTQDIVALARPHVGTQITTYSGSVASTTSSYVPMLFKKAYSNTYVSALYVQNLSAVSANVTIDFYTAAGVKSCTKNVTLAARAAIGYWLPSESCLPDGWSGGAMISSTQAVVAVGRPHITIGSVTEVTAYPGLPVASLKSYLPMLFKKAYGSYESALYVQNTDAGPAAISIKFYDLTGNVSCVVNETLPAFAAKGYWLPSLCMP